MLTCKILIIFLKQTDRKEGRQDLRNQQGKNCSERRRTEKVLESKERLREREE